MSDKIFDVIVVGVGGMGSAACWQLARRGQRVLGLERFDIPNARGSSHGITRIFRLAYYESPDYVPLLKRALRLWRDTSEEFGETLFLKTGSIDAGPPDDDVFRGSHESCRMHRLAHEVLSGAEVNARHPGFRLPDDCAAVFQPDGGFVLSERAIIAHVTMAMAADAEIHAREKVLEWAPIAGGGVRVKTTRGVYEAGRLVLSPGAWIGDLVPALASIALPERQVLGWFQPRNPANFAPSAFPVVNMLVPEGRYYVLPVYGIPGLKIGRYHHRGETCHADGLARETTAEDEAVLRKCIARWFPDADGPVMALHACMFTNTPDEHFIVDTLPGQPEVVVASPCSGHGYKFASVIGEIIADFVTVGQSRFDLSMFKMSRF